MLGKHFSPEHRAKLSAAKKGKPLSSEHKANLSKALKGRYCSLETRAKISESKKGEKHPMYGKHHSPETRAKIAEAQKGDKTTRWKGDKATAQTGRGRAEKLFACPKGLERHHIDGNPLNNDETNIKIVTIKEHRLLDGRSIHDRWGRLTKKSLPPPIRDRYGRVNTKSDSPPPKRDQYGKYTPRS